MIGSVKHILFRFTWFFMPLEARYAYLWERTRASYEDGISRGIY